MIGVLHSTSQGDVGSPILTRFDVFRRALVELGWMVGRNIRFVQRWTNNSELLPTYAAELVRLSPDAIFVTGSPSLRAVRGATSDIPIVFSAVTDPVGHSATISAGDWITATGDWINDRTHGQQFKARFPRTETPTSSEGIEKYLCSGMIRGIGPVYARKLVGAFAEKV